MGISCKATTPDALEAFIERLELELVVSKARLTAWREGRRRYEGELCQKQGHGTTRNVRKTTCVICVRERNNQYIEKIVKGEVT